jgi:N-acetyl-anhydromuramyl-L-alanine amidase AmpD
VGLVVIHSAEVGEDLGSAESLMRRCAVTDRVSSWHYAVDADSVTQSVREEDTAFHAPGANDSGVGIELAGTARQTAAEWDDTFSRATIARAAELAAAICARWSIPIEAVDAAGLLAGARGITTHAAVSKAFKRSTHTDPGPAFPLARFIELARAQAAAGGASQPPRPALARGDKGDAVVELQRRLNGAGADPPLKADGDFGERTERAVKRFQVAKVLPETGIADAATWARLPELAG